MLVGDGNGWAECQRGHVHWGLHGAAGILVTDGARVLLQRRAPWTHEGGTWAIPGGARNSDEDALTAALRETSEETTLVASDLQPYDHWIDDHGGWSYTTVIAAGAATLAPSAGNAETEALQWWPFDEVLDLDLHHGFASAWPHLRRRIRSARG